MNRETEQILRNQATILETLSEMTKDDLCLMRISNRLKEIEEMLHPEKEPTVPEKTNDALSVGCGKMFYVTEKVGKRTSGHNCKCGNNKWGLLCDECKLKVSKRGK